MQDILEGRKMDSVWWVSEVTRSENYRLIDFITGISGRVEDGVEVWPTSWLPRRYEYGKVGHCHV